jgi:hypothetical protein
VYTFFSTPWQPQPGRPQQNSTACVPILRASFSLCRKPIFRWPRWEPNRHPFPRCTLLL